MTRPLTRAQHPYWTIGHVILIGRKVPIVQVEIVGPVLAERVEADVSVIKRHILCPNLQVHLVHHIYNYLKMSQKGFMCNVAETYRM